MTLTRSRGCSRGAAGRRRRGQRGGQLVHENELVDDDWQEPPATREAIEQAREQSLVSDAERFVDRATVVTDALPADLHRDLADVLAAAIEAIDRLDPAQELGDVAERAQALLDQVREAAIGAEATGREQPGDLVDEPEPPTAAKVTTDKTQRAADDPERDVDPEADQLPGPAERVEVVDEPGQYTGADLDRETDAAPPAADRAADVEPAPKPDRPVEVDTEPNLEP